MSPEEPMDRTGGEEKGVGIWEENTVHGRCFSMITTDPKTAVDPVHDWIPAVLEDGQIGPCFDGSLNECGPSWVGLEFRKVENFQQSQRRPVPGGAKGAGGAPPSSSLNPVCPATRPGATCFRCASDRQDQVQLASPSCSMPEVGRSDYSQSRDAWMSHYISRVVIRARMSRSATARTIA
jgi:hypothetical protein